VFDITKENEYVAKDDYSKTLVTIYLDTYTFIYTTPILSKVTPEPPKAL